MALVGLQSVALAALAIAVAVTTNDAGSAFPVIGFSGLFAVLLAAIAVALWRQKRWALGAATAWSLLMVLVGFSQFSVNPAIACAVIAVGAATVAALVAPSTRAWLGGPTASGQED